MSLLIAASWQTPQSAKAHAVHANSSEFPQPKGYLSQVCPLSVVTILAIGTTRSGGGRDEKISILSVEKIPRTISKPTKNTS